MPTPITREQAIDYAHVLLSDQRAMDENSASAFPPLRAQYNAGIVHMIGYKTGMSEEHIRAAIRRAADVNNAGIDRAQESIDMLVEELVTFK